MGDQSALMCMPGTRSPQIGVSAVRIQPLPWPTARPPPRSIAAGPSPRTGERHAQSQLWSDMPTQGLGCEQFFKAKAAVFCAGNNDLPYELLPGHVMRTCVQVLMRCELSMWT